MIDYNHLHPMIVHFPIALVIVGFLSDLVGLVTRWKFFTSAGLFLIILGGLGTLAAYLSGSLAGDGIEEFGALGTALDTHESSAVLTVWTMMILAVLRTLLAVTGRMKGWMKLGMVILLAIGVGTVARTGYYGGELVYRHAAGVDLTFGSAFTHNAASPAFEDSFLMAEDLD